MRDKTKHRGRMMARRHKRVTIRHLAEAMAEGGAPREIIRFGIVRGLHPGVLWGMLKDYQAFIDEAGRRSPRQHFLTVGSQIIESLRDSRQAHSH